MKKSVLFVVSVFLLGAGSYIGWTTHADSLSRSETSMDVYGGATEQITPIEEPQEPTSTEEQSTEDQGDTEPVETENIENGVENNTDDSNTAAEEVAEEVTEETTDGTDSEPDDTDTNTETTENNG